MERRGTVRLADGEHTPPAQKAKHPTLGDGHVTGVDGNNVRFRRDGRGGLEGDKLVKPGELTPIE